MGFYSLKTKMTAAVFLLVLSLSFAFAGVSVYYFEKSFKENISKQQFTLLSSLAGNIDDKLFLAQNALKASNVLITPDIISDPLKAQHFLDSQISLRTIFNNALFLFSKDGKLIAESPYLPGRRGRDISFRDFFKKTVSAGRAQISEPYISTHSPSKPAIILTIPIFDEHEDLVAIMAGGFDLLGENILQDLLKTKIGSSGYLYLSDSNRTIIIHPDSQRIMSQASPVGINKPFDRAQRGFEGSGETKTSNGAVVLATFKRLRATNWILAANFPLAEAYAPIYRARDYYLVGTFVAALFSALLVWGLMNFLTKPLLVFSRHIGDLSNRTGEQKPVPISSRDEIGTLAQAFNAMLADLNNQKKDLHRQVRFLEILMETMPIPIFYKDVQGRHLGCNSAFEAFIGLSREEIKGKSAYDLAPKDLADRYHRADSELLARQEPQILESAFVAGDGKRHEVVFYKSTFPDVDGSLGGLIGSILDVTEQKRAEKLLIESEKRFRTLFDNAADAIFVHDSAGRIIEVNERACLQLGYSKDELHGMSLADIIVPACASAVCQGLHEIARDGLTCFEASYRRKDGTIISVEQSNRIFDHAGEQLSLFIARDITERKSLEIQLRQSQKFEAIGTLAGGIAHDFNNILTIIVGYATILQMKMGADNPLLQQLYPILAASERAANLTKSLLAYSRKQISNPESVDLNAVFEGVEILLRRLIPESIVSKISLCADPLPILADSGQIEQALMNLVGNSRDAMPGGGEISIRTGKFIMTQEFVSSHGYGNAGDYALLAVSDTGTGMSQETRERIFEPFFSTKETGKGTGLGLSMVYGIVKQHGGFISVDSQHGAGTTFTIYLPLAITPTSLKEYVSRKAIPPHGGGETILLVEDDKEVRQLLKVILERHSYKVIEAENGAEGIEKFKEYRKEIHLLLTDVMMPMKNGRETYDEIKRLQSDVKAIFMSGYSASFTQGLLPEELYYLAKPVSPHDLIAKIQEVLGK